MCSAFIWLELSSPPMLLPLGTCPCCPQLNPGTLWKSTVWPWWKQCWRLSTMTLTACQYSSPFPGTVSFTKTGQQIRVTHATATLQRTKYLCPLNTKELEPKPEGFKSTEREPLSQVVPPTLPRNGAPGSCGVSWIPAAAGSRTSSVRCMAPTPKREVRGTNLRR